MNRISQAFTKGPAFISYVTAGDGGADYTVEACLALIEGGVDLLEIGIPFSDPVADGPVIQLAMQRALKQGTTPHTLLKVVRKIRTHSDIPIILFSYYNPIFALGQPFLEEVYDAGCDGALIVDLPLEEADPYKEVMLKTHLEPIFIATPASTDLRLIEIDKASKGFIYYACRKGTTGVRSGLPATFSEDIQRVKKYAHQPVIAGFGISSRETAVKALHHSDGFVVGSAFVKIIEEGGTPEDLKAAARRLDPRS